MVEVSTVRARITAWGMFSLICSVTFTLRASSSPMPTFSREFTMFLFVIVWTFPVTSEEEVKEQNEWGCCLDTNGSCLDTDESSKDRFSYCRTLNPRILTIFYLLTKKKKKANTYSHTSVKASPEIIQRLSLRDTRQIILPFLYISSLDKSAKKSKPLLSLTEK